MSKLLLPAGFKDQRKNFLPGKEIQLVTDVSGFLEGELKDWPSNIQEAIQEALEKKRKEDGRHYEIVKSRCGRDDGVFYIHVIAYAKPETVQ